MVSKVKRRNHSEWFDAQPKILQYLLTFIYLIIGFTAIGCFVYYGTSIQNKITDRDGKLDADITLQIENYGYTLDPIVDRTQLLEACLHEDTIILPVKAHKQGAAIDKVTMQCIARNRYPHKVIIGPYVEDDASKKMSLTPADERG